MPGFGWRAGLWVQLASGLAPRRGPEAPRVPVESQAIRLFCRPHLELFFAFVPRKTCERLARASPSPVGHPASGGEPGGGLSRLGAWHPGGGTRLPGSAWRAGQKGLSGVYTWKVSHSCPGMSRQGLAHADALLPRVRVERAHPGRLTRLPGAAWRAGQNATLCVIRQSTL